MEGVKEILESMTFHEAWKIKQEAIESGEEMSYEKAWALCDPHRNIVRTDNGEWEDVRKNYNEWRAAYIEAHLKLDEAKRTLEDFQKEMNASVPHGITEEQFNTHYRLSRDLQVAWGTELGLMNGYGCAAVVFLDAIERFKGEMN